MTARHSRRGRPLCARDSDRGRLLEGGAGSGPHRLPAPRPRQVHLPGPDPEGRQQLTDEDWNIIRMHPYQGARIVAQIEGYGPISEIILASSRADRRQGLPAGPEGDEIPAAVTDHLSRGHLRRDDRARLYRKPISSFEAIQELKRVAGTQLDADYVELFIDPGRQGRALPPRRGRRLRRRAGHWTSVSPSTHCRSSSRKTTPKSSRPRTRGRRLGEPARAGAPKAPRGPLAASRDSSCATRSGGRCSRPVLCRARSRRGASAAAPRRRASENARRRAGQSAPRGSLGVRRRARPRASTAPRGAARARWIRIGEPRLVAARHEL